MWTYVSWNVRAHFFFGPLMSMKIIVLSLNEFCHLLCIYNHNATNIYYNRKFANGQLYLIIYRVSIIRIYLNIYAAFQWSVVHVRRKKQTISRENHPSITTKSKCRKSKVNAQIVINYLFIYWFKNILFHFRLY